MNAVNPLQPAHSTGSESRAAEPSMEEILASIRRIIADDQTAPMRAQQNGGPGRRDSDSHRASELQPHPAGLRTRSEPDRVEPALAPFVARHVDMSDVALAAVMAHGPVAAPQYPTPLTPAQAAAASADREAEMPTSAAASSKGMILQEPALEPDAATPAVEDDASDLHFDAPLERAEEPASPTLASDLFSTTTGQSVSSAFNVLAAARFADNSDELLNLAREMMRPLLKTWLDDNLPSMVERMVRAEIERVARGSR